MASFYVGQRVRLVNVVWTGDPDRNPCGQQGCVTGVGTFVAYLTGNVHAYRVETEFGQRVLASAHELEPLSGPSAEDLARAKELLNSLPAYVPGLAHV